MLCGSSSKAGVSSMKGATEVEFGVGPIGGVYIGITSNWMFLVNSGRASGSSSSSDSGGAVVVVVVVVIVVVIDVALNGIGCTGGGKLDSPSNLIGVCANFNP